MSLKLYPLGVVGAAVCAAIIAACAVPAHAQSRSFSAPKPSPVRVAPRPLTPPVKPPAPRVINKTTNNTTVVLCKLLLNVKAPACLAIWLQAWAVQWLALCWVIGCLVLSLFSLSWLPLWNMHNLHVTLLCTTVKRRCHND